MRFAAEQPLTLASGVTATVLHITHHGSQFKVAVTELGQLTVYRLLWHADPLGRDCCQHARRGMNGTGLVPSRSKLVIQD